MLKKKWVIGIASVVVVMATLVFMISADAQQFRQGRGQNAIGKARGGFDGHPGFRGGPFGGMQRGPQFGPPFGRPGGPDFLGGLHQRFEHLQRAKKFLDLTDEQIEQFKALKGSVREELKAVHQAKKALFEAVMAEEVNEVTIRSKAAELGEVVGDAAVKVANTIKEAKAILTPEQQEKLEELKEKRDAIRDEKIERIKERLQKIEERLNKDDEN